MEACSTWRGDNLGRAQQQFLGTYKEVSKEMKPGSSQRCVAGEDDKTDINPSMEGRFRLVRDKSAVGLGHREAVQSVWSGFQDLTGQL